MRFGGGMKAVCDVAGHHDVASRHRTVDTTTQGTRSGPTWVAVSVGAPTGVDADQHPSRTRTMSWRPWQESGRHPSRSKAILRSSAAVAVSNTVTRGAWHQAITANSPTRRFARLWGLRTAETPPWSYAASSSCVGSRASRDRVLHRECGKCGICGIAW